MNYLADLVNKTLEINPDGQVRSFPHVMVFFALALQNKAKQILELGVRDGGSTYPFLVASRILRGTLTSVDLNEPNFRPSEDLKKNWKFIKSDSIEFLKNNSVKYDIIYVDDWHSADHVKRELELIDLISDEHTLILLHDTMPNSCPNYTLTMNMGDEWSGGGPYKALCELDKEKWEWATLPQSHGLTILRKRGEVKVK